MEPFRTCRAPKWTAAGGLGLFWGATAVAGAGAGRWMSNVTASPVDLVGIAVLVFLLAGLLALNRKLRRNAREIEASRREIQAREEEYRLLVESSPAPIIVHAENRVIFTNAAAAEALGAESPQALLGKPVLDFVHPDFRSIVRERIEAEYGAGEPAPLLEEKFLCLDGRVIDVEVAAVPITFEGRRAVHAIFYDVTERKRFLARFQKIVESMPVMLCAVDENERIVAWNRESARVTGYSAEEVLGKPKAWDLLVPGPGELEDFRALACPGPAEVRQRRVRVRCKDGGVRIISWSTMPQTASIPDWAAWGVGVDVTDWVESEKALRGRERELADVSRRMRLVLDTIPIRVFWKDRNGRYQGCNRWFAEDAGFSRPEEVVGRTDAEMPWAMEGPILEEEDRRIIETGQPLLGRELEGRVKGGMQVARRNKVPLRDARGEIVGVLGTYEDITQERRRDEEIRRLAAAVEHNASGVLIHERDGTIVYSNPAMARILGVSQDEILGRKPWDLFVADGHVDNRRIMVETLESNRIWKSRRRLRTKSGEFRHVQVTVSPISDGAGLPVNYVTLIQDVTREVKLEEDVRQAQRLEMVGRLAGGIAHDFRNILQVQKTSLEFIRQDLPPGHPVIPDVEEAIQAADKLGEFTSQLLAFSRRQVLKLTVVDVNEFVGKIVKALRRMIPADIEIQFFPGQGAGRVRVDPAQFEQVLLNLAFNARDAMPEGGTLTFETGSVLVDAEYCASHDGVTPGRYTLISVTDTGTGMDEETRSHIFDPFFTTKDVGEGSGLGLAVVYGMVRQHGGMIRVYSELNKGTMFKIYLPVSERRAVEVKPELPGAVRGGTETLLVVEDDPDVARTTRRSLEEAGYTVILAETVEAAVEVFRRRAAEIDLVFLDVVMPGGGGKTAWEQIRRIRPDVAVLFASGYSENGVHTRFIQEAGNDLLQKPYKRADLLRRVREKLDEE